MATGQGRARAAGRRWREEGRRGRRGAGGSGATGGKRGAGVVCECGCVVEGPNRKNKDGGGGVAAKPPRGSRLGSRVLVGRVGRAGLGWLVGWLVGLGPVRLPPPKTFFLGLFALLFLEAVWQY